MTITITTIIKKINMNIKIAMQVRMESIARKFLSKSSDGSGGPTLIRDIPPMSMMTLAIDYFVEQTNVGKVMSRRTFNVRAEGSDGLGSKNGKWMVHFWLV